MFSPAGRRFHSKIHNQSATMNAALNIAHPRPIYTGFVPGRAKSPQTRSQINMR
jgi:hypothetical protein